jgi:hypothetical protein
MNKKLILGATVGLLVVTNPAWGFKVNFFGLETIGKAKPIHEDITKQALDDITVYFPNGTKGTLKETPKDRISVLASFNDEYGLDYGDLHFDDSRLEESASRIRKLIILAANDYGTDAKIKAAVWRFSDPKFFLDISMAMHTTQDFFAHSTWVETNFHLKAFDQDNKLEPLLKKLPYPKLGILENPFGSEFNSPSGFKVLDDNPSDSLNDYEDGGCNYEGYDAAVMQLTSAYYDYSMSTIPKFDGIDLGYSTTPWRDIRKATNSLTGRFQGDYITWPKERCVHGDDAGSGINKDHEGRYLHKEARQSAVEASRSLMLEFLRLSGATTEEGREQACKLIFDCTVGTKPSISNIKLSHITSSTDRRNVWSFSVSNNLNASMLAASFNGAECEVFEYEPFEEFEKQPALMCPSAYKGKGTLKIYQKANPTFILHQVDNFSVNPEVTIDHYPLSGLTGVIGICTFCEGLVSHGVISSYDINWGDGKLESFVMGNQDAQHKHVYASEGEKLVVITFKDKFGNTFEQARTINISKSVMAIQNGTTQKAGQAVGFSMEKVFSDATSVFWRFFDSIGEVVQSFLKAVSEQVSLAFEDGGDYKAVAEIRSGQGLLEKVEQNFQVVSVSQIMPSKAIADKKTLFTLTGSGLNSALEINFDNCDNIIRLGATTTELKFECTPKLIGTGTLQLKSQAGVLLWSTDVRFEYAPIQPEQPTQGFSYITEPLAFMNQGSRYNEPSYWSDSNPVELASYSMEYVQDVNKFAVKTYSTNGASSNIWKNDPRTQLVFSIQGNKWVEINGGEKQATEGLIGTSGIKTVNITDSQGIQYYTMLERDLTGKMIVEGITSGFGDGRQLPSAANTAMFSDGAKAYTWIRDVLTPNYNIPRTHYVFTTRNEVMPIYACVNIGACSTKVGTLQEAITKQAWLRNGGQSASIRVKSGDKAELLVKDPVTNVNSMYIINYQLINATMGNPVRIIFDTPEAVAKKALSDYFGVNDAQLAWYEYDGQVVRGSYQPPIKGQVSQSYQYNKTAINDILTKWFPSKSPVLD